MPVLCFLHKANPTCDTHWKNAEAVRQRIAAWLIHQLMQRTGKNVMLTPRKQGFDATYHGHYFVSTGVGCKPAVKRATRSKATCTQRQFAIPCIFRLSSTRTAILDRLWSGINSMNKRYVLTGVGDINEGLWWVALPTDTIIAMKIQTQVMTPRVNFMDEISFLSHMLTRVYRLIAWRTKNVTIVPGIENATIRDWKVRRLSLRRFGLYLQPKRHESHHFQWANLKWPTLSITKSSHLNHSVVYPLCIEGSPDRLEGVCKK